jgi:hypothetical protein
MEQYARSLGSRRRGRGSRGRNARQPKHYLTLERLERRDLLTVLSWIGGSGNFDDPSHWTGGAVGEVPGLGDTALFSGGNQSVTISDGQQVDLLKLQGGANLTLAGGGLLIAGLASLDSSALIVQGSGAQLEVTTDLIMSGTSALTAEADATVLIGQTLDLGTSGGVFATDGIVYVGATTETALDLLRAPAVLAGRAGNVAFLAARDIDLNVRSNAVPINQATGGFSTLGLEARYREGARLDLLLLTLRDHLDLAGDFFSQDFLGDAALSYNVNTGKLRLDVPVSFESSINVAGGTATFVGTGQLVAYTEVGLPGQALDFTTLNDQFDFIINPAESFLTFSGAGSVSPIGNFILQPQGTGTSSLQPHFGGTLVATFTARAGAQPATIAFDESSLIAGIDQTTPYLPGPEPLFNGLQILPAGTLQGRGFVDGPLTNDGRIHLVAPTNAFPALSVGSGNYVQTDFGTLEVDVSPNYTTSGSVLFVIQGAALLANDLRLNLLGDFNQSTLPLRLINPVSPGSTFAHIDGNRAAGTYFSVAPGPLGELLLVPQQAGLVVETSPNFYTDESGKTATFGVRLTAPPTAPVTVQIGTSDASEGTATNATGGNTLLFTVDNWSQLQTVVVTGIDDLLADGDISYFVNLHVVSNDPAYAGLDDVRPPLVNRDNESNQEKLAAIRLKVTDSQGNVLPEIAVGQSFYLEMWVDDLRGEESGSLLAAYADIIYSAARASVAGAAVFAADYPLDRSLSTATNGLLDELGAATTTELGSTERLLVRVPFVATSEGSLGFTANAAGSAGHGVRLAQFEGSLPPNRVDFGNTSVEVVLPLVSAGPFVSYIATDLGNGLTAYDVYLDDPNNLQLSYFADSFQFNGAINQVSGPGSISVNDNQTAASLDGIGGYSKIGDSYFYKPWTDNQSQAIVQTATTYSITAGTGGGSQYDVIQLARIVASGNVTFSGVVGRNAQATPVSGTLVAPAAASQSISIGELVSGSIDTPGAVKQYQFSATAGQVVFFDLQQLSSSNDVDFRLQDPNGATVFASTVHPANVGLGDRGPLVLDLAGTYTLVVDPQGDATSSFQFKLWNVPATTSTSISVGDVVADSIDTPGAVNQYQFSAAAGQVIYFDLQQLTSSIDVDFRLQDPNGATVFASTVHPANLNLGDRGPLTLSVTGTYTLIIDGQGDSVPSYQFKVDSASTHKFLTWVGGDGAFNDPAHWTGGVPNEVPESGDTAVFNGGNHTVTISDGQQVDALLLQNGATVTFVGTGLLKAGQTTLSASSLIVQGDASQFESTTTMTLTGASSLATSGGAIVFVGQTLDLGAVGQVDATGGSIFVGVTAAQAEVDLLAPGLLGASIGSLGRLAVRDIHVAYRSGAILINQETGIFTTNTIQAGYLEGGRIDAILLATRATINLTPGYFNQGFLGDATLSYEIATGKLRLDIPVNFVGTVYPFGTTFSDFIRFQATGQTVAFADVGLPGQPLDFTTLDNQFDFIVDPLQSILNFDISGHAPAPFGNFTAQAQHAGSLTARFGGKLVADFTPRTATESASIRFLETSVLDGIEHDTPFLPGPLLQESGLQVLPNGKLTGRGSISGNVNNEGLIQLQALTGAASGAALTVIANFAQSPFGTLQVDATPNYSAAAVALAVTDAASIDNRLRLNLSGDFSNVSQPLFVLGAPSRTGTFSNFDGNRSGATYFNLNNSLPNVVGMVPQQAGLVVETSPDFYTDESGKVATFGVKLTSAPTAPVTVQLGTSDASEGTATNSTGGTTLVFTADNWNQSQSVIVSGVDDLEADGDFSYFVNLHVVSSDLAFSGLTDVRPPLVNRDNETSQEKLAAIRLKVTNIDGVEVSEVAVNQKFNLELWVDDLRVADPGSILAAYADIVFSAARARQLAPASFSSDFPLDRSLLTATAGLLDEFGAATATGLGSGERRLASVSFVATSEGLLGFTANAAGGASHGVRLSGLTGSIPPSRVDFGSASVNIVDSTAPPTLSIDNATVDEGNDGTVNMTFTVSLSRAAASEVTVNYATAGDTALAGGDFDATSGTLTFAQGERTKTITVAVRGDTFVERTETFQVLLSNPTGATIAAGAGTGTILNDDPPTLLMDDVRQLEGTGGDTKFVFRVRLSQVIDDTMTVLYQVGQAPLLAIPAGTATPGVDFTNRAGYVTFNPGEIEKTFEVHVVADGLEEDNEVFYVGLYDVRYDRRGPVRRGIIVDDDDDANNNLPDQHAPEVEFHDGHGEVNGQVGAGGPNGNGGSGELVDLLLTEKGPAGLAGDWDFVRFELALTTVVRIEVLAERLPTPSSLDAVLALLKLDGVNGAEIKIVATNDDTIGRDPVIEVELPAGNYAVGVGGAQGTRGPYRLLIDLDRPPVIDHMAPDNTLGASPGVLTLFLNEVDLDPDTVLKQAFELLAEDPVTHALSALNAVLGDPQYLPGLHRILVPVSTSLASGKYLLRVGETIMSEDGTPLRGAADLADGVAFVGTFSVDTLAPVLLANSLRVGGATTIGAGLLYRLVGQLSDGAPASAGELVRVELDIDGDGEFDDGSATVPLEADGSTLFNVSATTPLPPGGGSRDVAVRFVDARNNISAPFTLAIDTSLPIVTNVRAAATGPKVLVSFSRDDLQNIDQVASYSIAGRTVVGVAVSDDRRTAELTLDQLPDGVYAISVHTGAGKIFAPGQTTPELVASNQETPELDQAEAPAALDAQLDAADPVLLDGNFDGTPGDDFTANFTVDRTGPTVQSVKLQGATDADNRTNDLQPTLLITVNDIFPSAAIDSPLTLSLDLDDNGLFDDGSMTFSLSASNQARTVSLQINHPLNEGNYTAKVRLVDAAGNAATPAVFTFTVDRLGPKIVSTDVDDFRDAEGIRTGRFEIVLEFDEDLDSAAAVDLLSYRLIRAGGDGNLYAVDSGADQSDGILSRVYKAASAGGRARVTVTIDLAGRPDDDYQLIVNGQRLIDAAGNRLVGGDYRMGSQAFGEDRVESIQWSAQTNSRVISAEFASTSVNGASQLRDLIVLRFSGPDLVATQVENLAKYALVRLDSPAGPVGLSSVSYDPLTDRAILRLTSPVADGTYSLTIRRNAGEAAGINSLAGSPLLGPNDLQASESIVLPVTVGALATFQNLLNDQFPSLAQYADQVTLDAANSRKTVSNLNFATRLLQELQLAGSLTGTSQQVAAAINAALAQLISAELGGVDADNLANQGEFVVLWSREARFLLGDPSNKDVAGNNKRVGQNDNGLLIQEIPGATLVQVNTADGPLMLMILPIEPRADLLGNDLVSREDGKSAVPSFLYSLELEGFSETNQAGYLFVNSASVIVSNTFADVAVGTDANPFTTQQFNLAPTLTGVDPNIKQINDHVQKIVEGIFGPLSQLTHNLLWGWIDPVDYALGIGQSQLGSQGGLSIDSAAGGSIANNGATGLVVWSGAPSGIYNLAFNGLGTPYRGALNFNDGTNSLYASVQGELGLGSSLLAQVDFRLPGVSPPPPGVDINGALAAAAFALRAGSNSAGGLLGSGLSPAIRALASAGGDLGVGGLLSSILQMASHVGRQKPRSVTEVLGDLLQLRGNVARNTAFIWMLPEVDRLIAEASEIDANDVVALNRIERAIEALKKKLGGGMASTSNPTGTKSRTNRSAGSARPARRQPTALRRGPLQSTHQVGLQERAIKTPKGGNSESADARPAAARLPGISPSAAVVVSSATPTAAEGSSDASR